MSDRCQHLDGRVVIRGRDGAPEQLRRGLAGVGAFAAAAAVGTLVLVGGSAALLFPGGLSTVALPPSDATDPAALARVLPLLAPLVTVYTVGALGYLVRWRREYDVRVEVREGLLRWD
jgi:hypothetical protein